MKYFVLLIFQLTFCLTIAHGQDTTQNKLKSKSGIGKSFFISGNLFIPINDLKEVGAHLGIDAMPGLSIDFNKLHIGILLSAELTLIAFKEERMNKYFRSQFSELEEYNNADSKTGEELMKTDLYLGIYYERFFSQHYGVRFYLLGSKSWGFANLLASSENVSAYFPERDRSISYTLYPLYPKINTCLSIEAFRTVSRKNLLGLKINYCNMYSTAKISESHYNEVTEVKSETVYTENYNFSYLQVGVNLRVPF
jgi:hypothetical protein